MENRQLKERTKNLKINHDCTKKIMKSVNKQKRIKASIVNSTRFFYLK